MNKKYYIVESLAEFFPNTLAALEALSQNCQKKVWFHFPSQIPRSSRDYSKKGL